MGVYYFEKAIPSVVNYGALIYVNDATSDSITYQVSMNDVEYSYMGHSEYAGGAGLYAVRFTDKDGNQVLTKYDSEVYSCANAKQIFELSKENLRKMTDTYNLKDHGPFTLNIYAVVDLEHNGKSFPIDADPDSGQDWKYFFGESENKEMNKIAEKYSEFLGKFWKANISDAGRPNIEAMDTVETKFRVAERKQGFTDDDGVFINEDAKVLKRGSLNRLQMYLPESFGIVKESQVEGQPGEQMFKRIDWTVSGQDRSGKVIKVTGTGGEFFKSTDAGNNVFIYEIPQDVSYGNYSVVIQLWRKESQQAPDYTFSFTHWD